MAQRIVSILTADSIDNILDELDGEHNIDITDKWQLAGHDDRIWHQILLDAEDSQTLLDAMQPLLEKDTIMRITVAALEASLPKSQVEKKKDDEEKEQPWFFSCVGREELYEHIVEGTILNANYLLLTFIATIVAAAALLDDNIAVLIGAMVIAPLLGPNLALGFGVVIGDLSIIKRALKAGVIGIGITLVTPALIGLFFEMPQEGILSDMTRIGYDNILIAVCSGVVGVVALSQTTTSNLVGVMVAVALLPPAVATGLFVGAGDFVRAGHTGLLLAINIAGVSLASQITFYLLGIKPAMQSWLQEDKAKKLFHKNLWIWAILMVAFIAVLIWMRDGSNIYELFI